MKVTKVTYCRWRKIRRSSSGNMDKPPAKIELTIELNGRDKVEDAIKRAELTVAMQFGEVTQEDIDEAIEMGETFASVKPFK